ncbi:Uncharacterised protein [Sphingobacterium spiritivorum]|uniref:Lipoprotein n=1 Tax=Sphingobacterium spiritivorum TaxID=258 RepID=A0A380CRP4_SPHSI|nr:hypothetical protein [Sphingobacterium spiritivorum]SUJ25807.1 Uncharacterised protein [Sphingobacterium spiritivorum]
MKKLLYLTLIVSLLFSCSKKDNLYYNFDTEFGLEIKDKSGKDLLITDLVVEKIILSGSNNGGDSPTGGRITPDVPPFEAFSVKKNGSYNTLYLTFAPIYKESNITIKWKNISKQDSMKAELYNKNNTVYVNKIFWNGNLIWTEGQQKNKKSIKIEKDL